VGHKSKCHSFGSAALIPGRPVCHFYSIPFTFACSTASEFIFIADGKFEKSLVELAYLCLL